MSAQRVFVGASSLQLYDISDVNAEICNVWKLHIITSVAGVVNWNDVGKCLIIVYVLNSGKVKSFYSLF